MTMQRLTTDPTQATVQGVQQPAQPSTGMTPQARATQWENDSVAGRVADITAQSSPIMRQARSAGMRQGAARGMLNSSMAIQAAEDSAYKAATPIASQDAAQAAARNQQRVDGHFQGERQRADLSGAMQRLRAQAGFDRDARRDNFGFQTQLNDQQIQAERERLTQQLTHATESQRAEIQARIGLLDREIEGRANLSEQEFGQTRTLNQDSYTAERQRLTQQLSHATASQRTEIQARLDLLDREWEGRSQISRQEFGQQTQLARQQLNGQMQQIRQQQAGQVRQLQMQINSSEGMQRRELTAQMERLQESQKFELVRLETAFEFDTAMAGIQNGYNVDMTKLQAGLQSALQAQGNDEQMERMAADFGHQQKLAAQQGKQALDQIRATGDQRLVEQANQIQASLQELTLQLNQRNSEAMASAAVQLFQAEAQIRGMLLNNPQMPAAERAGYERAISGLTAPTRQYINQVLGGGSGDSTGTPTTTPGTGGMTPTTPTTGVVSPGGMVPGGADYNRLAYLFSGGQVGGSQ